MNHYRAGPLCLLAMVATFASCIQNSTPNRNSTTTPRIVGDGNTPILCCWFVEDNGVGKCGYAAADGRLGGSPPDGGGLFASIEELRHAMKGQKIQTAYIEPTFGGELPTGWKIRGLTPNEVQKLVGR